MDGPDAMSIQPWLILVTVLVLPAILASDSCTQQARPGYCHQQDPPRPDVTTTSPVWMGSCRFRATLCHYMQGCQDDAMSIWSSDLNGVRVNQKEAVCSQAYSILESPLLNMNGLYCIDFMYTNQLPTWLDVYLETDSGAIITVLESHKNQQTGKVFSYTVFNITAKIKFRARGGGNTRSPAAKLDYVSVGPGNCSAGPSCSFNALSTDVVPMEIFCGWKPKNWHLTGTLTIANQLLNDVTGAGKFAYVLPLNEMSSLTSNVVHPTKSNSPDCLEFLYVVKGVGATLSVSIEILTLSGGNTTLWSFTSDTLNRSVHWSSAAVPIESSTMFKIRFGTAPTSDTSAVIAIDNVTYKRDTLGCKYIPEDAEVVREPTSPSSTPTATQTTTTLSSVTSTPNGPTTYFPSSGFSHSVNPTSESSGIHTDVPSSTVETTDDGKDDKVDDTPEMGGDDGANVAAIVGAMVGVLIIIALVVVGVIFWRRRSRKERRAAKDWEDANCVGPEIHQTRDSDFTQVDRHIVMYNPQFSQSTHAIDSGYSDVTLASTDPDDIADDGAPGKTRFNLDGEYNVLDVHGVDRELLKPQELDNDDYSHINSQPVDATYSSVQKGQGAAPEQRPAVEFDVSQLYSHVQKKGKGAAAVQRPQVGSDVSALYSQVQKKGKTTTPGVEGATGDSDVSALYSQVQKKGKTTTPFGVEGATGDSDGSALYSQVQKQGKKPVVAQKPKVALKPGVTDNYNRIDFPGDKPDLNGVDYTEDDAADTYNKLEHDVRRK